MPWGSENRLLEQGGPSSGLINLGPVGAAALGAAGFLPGWAGTGFSAANMLGQAYNTYQTGNIRQRQGLPALSSEQWLSGLSGIGGGYGSLGGNATIANPAQFTDRMNQLFSQNRLYSGGGLPGSSLAETLNGDPYNSFNIGPFALGASTPALSYGMMQQLLNRINTGQTIPYDTPTTYAPTGVMNPPKPASPYAGATPVYQRDGMTQTLIGYQTPDGSTISPDAYNMAMSGLSPSVIGGVGGNGGGYMSSRAGQGSFSDGMGGTTSVGASGQLGHI